jgi:hypothetical protein
VDLTGEVLTEDTIGYLMFAINLPMALYFVYGVWEDVGDHVAEAAELLSLTQSNADDKTETTPDTAEKTHGVKETINPMLEPDVQKSEL